LKVRAILLYRLKLWEVTYVLRLFHVVMRLRVGRLEQIAINVEAYGAVD